jgi:ATP/maltotriose-dependent transcriptional regulator MalT
MSALSPAWIAHGSKDACGGRVLLTNRQVVDFRMAGKSRREIATEMRLSLTTVARIAREAVA